MMNYVNYYRVSTKKQGYSGLGLEAQQRATEYYIQSHGGGHVLDSYIEVESGSNNKRPKLAAALALCKETGATLIVAKLDRLARSVYFISCLQQSKQPFVCCDQPDATAFTINVYAALAQQELDMIRSRTKAGLESTRLRGTLLGSARPGHWDGREHLRGWNAGLQKFAKERAEELEQYYAIMLPAIKQLRAAGKTLDEVAACLNDKGQQTSAKKPFSKGSVHRLISKYMDDKYLGRQKSGKLDSTG